MKHGRLVTVSHTGINAPGGVPAFNRELHKTFRYEGIETLHFCWDDHPEGRSQGFEWFKARALNSYLIEKRLIDHNDIIVADGFWAEGLHDFPYAISHSHGIWGHLKCDEFGQREIDMPLLHFAQVDFRNRWKRLFRKKITAVSNFVADEIERYLGIEVDTVINNAIPYEFFTSPIRLPSSDERTAKIAILHGVNDRSNGNKGWEFIEKTREEITRSGIAAELYLLDDFARAKNIAKTSCFAAADLFIHPSGFEGNSTIIAEAMASGIPIVGYDVGFLGSKCFLGSEEILNSLVQSPYGKILSTKERDPFDFAHMVVNSVYQIGDCDQLEMFRLRTKTSDIAKNIFSPGEFRYRWKSFLQGFVPWISKDLDLV